MKGGRSADAQPRRPLFRFGALVAGALALSGLGFGLGGCTTAASRDAPSAPDRHTLVALMSIARRFNAEYAANDDAPVYDRFDRASRAVIARSAYLARHRECPTAPGTATIEGASRLRDGEVAVRYSISGTLLTDYWHYVGGHWRFDLLRSNPDAVRLYRLPPVLYFAAVGCAHAH